MASRKRVAAGLLADGQQEAIPSNLEPNETHRRILAAALEEFAEHGFDGTSTASIAQRAEVAEKTIFARFRSKENLFRATIHPASLELLVPTAIEGLRSTLRMPWERLEDFLLAMFSNRAQMAASHPRKLKLLAQEVLLRPALFGSFVETFKGRIEPLIDAAAAQYTASGQLRPVPTWLLIRMMLFLIGGHVVGRFVLRPQAGWSDDELKQMVDVLVNGLRPRPSEEAPGAVDLRK